MKTHKGLLGLRKGQGDARGLTGLKGGGGYGRAPQATYRLGGRAGGEWEGPPQATN